MRRGERKENSVRLMICLFAAAGLWAGDTIGVGVRGGLPLGDAFTSLENRDFRILGRNRFVVGPTIELRLPAGLGVSFDVLYRRYRFEIDDGAGRTQSAAQWEFPLMVRYRFPGIIVRPFVGAGPSLNRLTGVTSIRNSTVGVAMGAGLDIAIPFFHITPELRYSRLFQENSVRPTASSLLQNQNRFDFLVGFTF